MLTDGQKLIIMRPVLCTIYREILGDAKKTAFLKLNIC